MRLQSPPPFLRLRRSDCMLMARSISFVRDFPSQQQKAEQLGSDSKHPYPQPEPEPTVEVKESGFSTAASTLYGGVLATWGIALARYFLSNQPVSDSSGRTERKYGPQPKPKTKMGRIEKNIKRIIQSVAHRTFQICVVEQVNKIKSFYYSPLSEIIFQPRAVIS